MSVRIRYSCPHCNRRILHHPELAGQLVICSACKGEFYEPTDPLPGKPAERALQPMPEATRRLRVPEGNNPRHDLAVLSRRDSSDMRSIAEIVEAVLLDDGPPLPMPSSPLGEETVVDFAYKSNDDSGRAGPSPARTSGNPAPMARIPARPGGPAPAASLAGPTTQPLVPPAAFIPATANPPGGAPKATPKPASPTAPPANRPVPAAGMGGVTIKQMVDELRRRGLGVALVTCEMAPIRNVELTFSDNMIREDALVLLRKYLDTLKENKTTEQAGLLKRLWKKGDGE